MALAPTRTKDSYTDWPNQAHSSLNSAHPAPTVVDGDLPLSILHINGGIIIRPRNPDRVPPKAQPLTDREREVLALVAEGNSNKQIGDKLSISERTVKSHLTYIMTKLNAADRTHAVVTAVRLGWLAI